MRTLKISNFPVGITSSEIKSLLDDIGGIKDIKFCQNDHSAICEYLDSAVADFVKKSLDGYIFKNTKITVKYIDDIDNNTDMDKKGIKKEEINSVKSAREIFIEILGSENIFNNTIEIDSAFSKLDKLQLIEILHSLKSASDMDVKETQKFLLGYPELTRIIFKIQLKLNCFNMNNENNSNHKMMENILEKLKNKEGIEELKKIRNKAVPIDIGDKGETAIQSKEEGKYEPNIIQMHIPNSMMINQYLQTQQQQQQQQQQPLLSFQPPPFGLENTNASMYQRSSQFVPWMSAISSNPQFNIGNTAGFLPPPFQNSQVGLMQNFSSGNLISGLNIPFIQNFPNIPGSFPQNLPFLCPVQDSAADCGTNMINQQYFAMRLPIEKSAMASQSLKLQGIGQIQNFGGFSQVGRSVARELDSSQILSTPSYLTPMQSDGMIRKGIDNSQGENFIVPQNPFGI